MKTKELTITIAFLATLFTGTALATNKGSEEIAGLTLNNNQTQTTEIA